MSQLVEQSMDVYESLDEKERMEFVLQIHIFNETGGARIRQVSEAIDTYRPIVIPKTTGGYCPFCKRKIPR